MDDGCGDLPSELLSWVSGCVSEIRRAGDSRGKVPVVPRL